MNVTLSIIIPIYNSQLYLDRCLTSIAEQTYHNLEIILVDDGSTDQSAAICKKYCKKDARFHYFYQDNQGVSVARNYGIQRATGRFITFVDSDDWISTVMYEKMLEKMLQNNSDIVICDVYETDGSNHVPDTLNLHKDGLLYKNNISISDLTLMAGAVWRCIFSENIVKKIEGFPDGLKLSEDCVFCIAAIGKSRCVYYLKEPFYYRYNRKGSAVYSFHSDMQEIQLYAYHEMVKMLKQYWDKKYVSIAEKYLAMTSLEILVSICDCRSNKMFHKKYSAVHQLCMLPEIQFLCKKDLQFNSKMWHLIKKKKFVLITLYAWLIGIKRKIKNCEAIKL